MDADPNTGVYVLDSYSGGWFQVGGTSLSSPMFAALVSIADQGRALQGEGTLDGATQTLPLLYSLPGSDFHDITTGGNGTYNAGVGYDLVTGLGSPVANLLVPALAGYSTSQPPSSPPAPQPPGVSGPSSAIVAQDGSLTLSSADGNAITLTDAAAGSNSDSLTLSVGDGTLTLGSTSGLTVVSGANGSSSITVSGTLSNLNTAVNGLVYTPGSGFTGSDSLSISLSDPGDSLSASHSVALSVNAPPWFGGPAYVWVNENSTLTFSSANGNALTIADSAAGISGLEMTINAAYGKVKFSSMSDLTLVSGANNSASVTVKGTLATINAALNGMVFTPTSGYAGSAGALRFSITDLGDGLIGTAAIGVSVYAAPKFTGPTSATVTENTPFVFSSGNSNAIGITDAAAAKGGNVQLALSATHGTLGLSTTAGLSFTAGSNHAASMTIVGTLTNILAALNGLTFTPTSKYTGSASLKLTTKDLLDGQSGTETITLKVAKASPAAVGGHSTSPPLGASGDGIVEGASVFAAGFFSDDLAYWEGLLAAIEQLNRP